MEITTALLTVWLGPVFAAWILLPTRCLNRSGAGSARVAESVAWLGFLSVFLGALFWLAGGRATWSWGPVDQFGLGLRLDALSVPLLLLVSFLAAVILRFSRNYLNGDARQGHFIKWICVTVGSVTLLISAPGLGQFFVAWVATSLSLHKLLVFFPDRHGTLFSARKKFLLSRTADLCILLAFGGLYVAFDTHSFAAIFGQLERSEISLAWIAWLIAFAAILKSAQFPFHTWLPDTMGTPTPVSALMHAGIINAGGILLIRFNGLFSQETGPLYAVAIVGAITAVFGAFVMLSQTSVKRSLAYSTIAQMGFMLMQCGLGAYSLALLHIVAHSLYKAHSFLSSGSTVEVIEANFVESNVTRKSHLPFLAALAVAFGIVFGVALLFGAGGLEKPGMIALGVVLAMAAAQLLLRRLRREASFLAIAKVAALTGFVTTLYFGLAQGAVWWMGPLSTDIKQTSASFEWGLALLLLLALATALQMQIGSRFLIPLRFRDALYVHAMNGFYANIVANRLLRLIKLQPKQA